MLLLHHFASFSSFLYILWTIHLYTSVQACIFLFKKRWFWRRLTVFDLHGSTVCFSLRLHAGVALSEFCLWTGHGGKTGETSKTVWESEVFLFFSSIKCHQNQLKPSKRKCLDLMFKGELFRTIYDSSIKIYNHPYNIRPYFAFGGVDGIWGWEVTGLTRMLDQDGSDSVGPWSILVFFSCTLAQVRPTRTTPWDVRGCLLRGSPGWWHGGQIWWIQAIYFLEIKCHFWYHVIMFQDVLTPEL